MATIPLQNRFHTTTEAHALIGASTANLGSAQANSLRETYSMQDIVDTVGTVDYPTFTTDLDTEIQVAPVSIGGVLTPLYYKRFQSDVAAGSSGTGIVTYAGHGSAVLRSNIIVGTLIGAPGTYQYQDPGFSYNEHSPQAKIFHDTGKNLTMTEVEPRAGAVGTFVDAYQVTFEIWYT